MLHMLQYVSIKDLSTLAAFHPLFFEQLLPRLLKSIYFQNSICHFIVPMGSQQKFKNVNNLSLVHIPFLLSEHFHSLAVFKIGCFSVSGHGTHLAST